MTLSAIQADIEEAEAHAAARRTSTQTELTSSRATDNTQSGNLSQQSNERKEADTLHKFTKLYEKIPRPTETEPIIYVEERREHDEEVLLQLDNHYQSLRDTLRAMTEIPISNKALLPDLQSATAFQRQIPEYLRTCNRHLRTIIKARRSAAEKAHGTSLPRERLQEYMEEATHIPSQPTPIYREPTPQLLAEEHRAKLPPKQERRPL